MTVLKAEGSLVWDGEGRRLIDLSCQLVNTNIGHRHPKVVAAIQEQAGRLRTIAPQHVRDARSGAAQPVAELTPGTSTTSSSPTTTAIPASCTSCPPTPTART